LLGDGVEDLKMVCLLFIAGLEYRDQDADPITISF
jgi:hypothetical protein